MRNIRVFVDRTSYTPNDEYAFIGFPPLPAFIPEHNEVHISCSFSWEKSQAEYLKYQWEVATDKPVKIGGPAFGSQATDFIQGMYLKPNIIFTTRGCNNHCPWCCVPKLEGNLKELPICQGNIIQDNNFLQSSRAHKNKVFDMLHGQRQIQFKGGLEAELLDDHFVNAVTSLKIDELWLACDTDATLPKFKEACGKLTKAGFTREKIKCYVLIGDDMDKNEVRLREVYEAGAMPFAQLYQPIGAATKKKYSKEWQQFHRMWSRPAATRAHMEQGTDFHDFNT